MPIHAARPDPWQHTAVRGHSGKEASWLSPVPDGGRLSWINVTPYIEILLVLLIVFMVIVSASVQGFTLQVPDLLTIPPAEWPANIGLHVRHDPPDTESNHHPSCWRNIPVRLVELCRERSHRTIFLVGDRAVPYADIVRVIDASLAAGVESVCQMTVFPE